MSGNVGTQTYMTTRYSWSIDGDKLRAKTLLLKGYLHNNEVGCTQEHEYVVYQGHSTGLEKIVNEEKKNIIMCLKSSNDGASSSPKLSSCIMGIRQLI